MASAVERSGLPAGGCAPVGVRHRVLADPCEGDVELPELVRIDRVDADLTGEGCVPRPGLAEHPVVLQWETGDAALSVV
jgi:hypothetical protein